MADKRFKKTHRFNSVSFSENSLLIDISAEFKKKLNLNNAGSWKDKKLDVSFLNDNKI